MSNNKILGPVEHVVVLMFENRSFDNVLGGLKPYGPGFDGVPPGWSNPNAALSKIIPAFQAPTGREARIMPYPDPLEDHSDMMAQIDNGSMQGFVNNYAKAKLSNPEIAGNIMQYYAPGQDGNIPITSALANAYAVSDTYHGSGPVQTWPNRLFAHCGTPGSNEGKSYINNNEYPYYPGMIGQLKLPSIFELLDQSRGAGQINWKVYYDGEWPISSLVNYVYENWSWEPNDKGNVFDFRSEIFQDFFDDVKQGTLPAYSFIEPRYTHYSLDPLKKYPPNSNHPGSASFSDDGPPIDIIFGEKLLLDVYQALAANKDLFKKTLLIVTYDEHGGCADHVAPPKAVSPFKTPVSNFDYTMYGPRVPAIFINPYIKKGLVVRPGNQPDKASVFDHTSIIATLREHFDLGGPLTPRDANAPTFQGLIDESQGYNEGPDSLPTLDLPSTDIYSETIVPSDTDKINKNSLAYVMYHAVLEKRRRLEKMDE
ncbi:MAG: hypothetical protein OEZ51_13730 [Nitrospinota bacterium]|nr:hypothetical protein [Nitrospinota bacterium]